MAYNLVYSKLLNQNYRGHAEQCSYTFTVNKPDQLGALWTAKEHLAAHIVELQKQGSTILEYYLWEDKSPTWSTDYYCKIVASASPLFWQLLILGVIAIIALLITRLVVKEIKEIFEYAGPALATAMQWGALAAIAGFTVLGVYLVKRKA